MPMPLDYACIARHLLQSTRRQAREHPADPAWAGKRRIFPYDFELRAAPRGQRLTATNLTVGLMPYSAPEQLMGSASSTAGPISTALAATISTG